MVIVPFSTDTLNTGMFSRRDGFPDVWLQLSSVKVAKAKAIGRKHNTAAFIFMFLQSVLPLGSPSPVFIILLSLMPMPQRKPSQ
ncbi:hypothetical protein NL676_025424 [Syzygium grande]|nr:hypothetical protein NL676_025424 [Syzygium grande]